MMAEAAETGRVAVLPGTYCGPDNLDGLLWSGAKQRNAAGEDKQRPITDLINVAALQEVGMVLLPAAFASRTHLKREHRSNSDANTFKSGDFDDTKKSQAQFAKWEHVKQMQMSQSNLITRSLHEGQASIQCDGDPKNRASRAHVLERLAVLPDRLAAVAAAAKAALLKGLPETTPYCALFLPSGQLRVWPPVELVATKLSTRVDAPWKLKSFRHCKAVWIADTSAPEMHRSWTEVVRKGHSVAEGHPHWKTQSLANVVLPIAGNGDDGVTDGVGGNGSNAPLLPLTLDPYQRLAIDEFMISSAAAVAEVIPQKVRNPTQPYKYTYRQLEARAPKFQPTVKEEILEQLKVPKSPSDIRHPDSQRAEAIASDIAAANARLGL